MRFDTFCALKSALEEMFSPSAATVILSSTASKCGKQSYKDIKTKIKAKENVLAYLSHLKESMNWGKIVFQNVNFQAGTGKIRVHDSFETLTRKCRQPSCYFLRGFFAGFLSELFDREIHVIEVKCAGTGDSDCCQFDFE
jgi:predicted hydrocarbon binding protein